MENTSPRVNSALLPKYIGRTVRLTCKVIKLQGDNAIVQAADGGQVTVKLLRDSNITDTFVDIIGKVVDEHTLRMLQVNNWGSDIDLELVNQTVEQLHRFGEWVN